MKKILLTLLVMFQFIILGFGTFAKEVDINEIQNTISDTSTISEDFSVMGLDINNYPSLYEEYEAKLETDKYLYDRYNNDVEEDNYSEINPGIYYNKWYCVGIVEKYDDAIENINLYIYFYNPYTTQVNSFLQYKDEKNMINFSVEMTIKTQMLDNSSVKTINKSYTGVSQFNIANKLLPFDGNHNTFLNKEVGADADEYQIKSNPFQCMVIKNVGKLSDNKYRNYTFNKLKIGDITICNDELTGYFKTDYNDNNQIIDITYDYDSTVVVTSDKIVTVVLDFGKIETDILKKLAPYFLLAPWWAAIMDYFTNKSVLSSMSLFFYNFNTNKDFDDLIQVSFNYRLYHYEGVKKSYKSKAALPENYEEVNRIVKKDLYEIEWGTDEDVAWRQNAKQVGKFNTITLGDQKEDTKTKRINELVNYCEKISTYEDEFDYQASILFDYRTYIYTDEHWGNDKKYDYFDVSNVTIGEMVYKYQGVTYKAKVIDDDNPDNKVDILPEEPITEKDVLENIFNWIKNNPEKLISIVFVIVLIIVLIIILASVGPEIIPFLKIIGKVILFIFKLIFWYPIKFLIFIIKSIFKLFNRKE